MIVDDCCSIPMAVYCTLEVLFSSAKLKFPFPGEEDQIRLAFMKAEPKQKEALIAQYGQKQLEFKPPALSDVIDESKWVKVMHA